MARNEDLWSAEVRRQAYVAIQVASDKHADATRALGYIVRTGMAHGLHLEDVCRAGNLKPSTVLALSDPAVTQ